MKKNRIIILTAFCIFSYCTKLLSLNISSNFASPIYFSGSYPVKTKLNYGFGIHLNFKIKNQMYWFVGFKTVSKNYRYNMHAPSGSSSRQEKIHMYINQNSLLLGVQKTFCTNVNKYIKIHIAAMITEPKTVLQKTFRESSEGVYYDITEAFFINENNKPKNKGIQCGIEKLSVLNKYKRISITYGLTLVYDPKYEPSLKYTGDNLLVVTPEYPNRISVQFNVGFNYNLSRKK